MILTGWLRSSEYGEVPMHSGMLADRRREQISVDLPCVAATVDTYSSSGRRLARRHPHRRELDSVQLTGDRVCFAEVRCAAQ